MTMLCPNCGATLDATLTLVAPPPPPPPPPPPTSTYSLQLSATPSRGAPVALDGKTVSGNIYVFVSPVTGISGVDFWLDDSAMTPPPYHSEGIAPYDFVNTAADGTALPFSTTGLASGPHTITAAVTKAAGGVDVIAATFTVSNAAPPPPPPTTGLAIKVSGNKLVDGAGKTVQLRGANRMGMEYACIQGWGISDGPLTQASIDAIKTWKINAIRVPLNEDCWLGINGVLPTYGGSSYQNAIKDYVRLLTASGIYTILDLHWTKPGTTKATTQDAMASADHSPVFWSQVAAAFKGNPAVIFDLFNEPHGISWAEWRNGNATYAGMQQLLNAVRAAGASNVCMAGGLMWANDLTGWLANRPADPAGQLAASWHVYSFNYTVTAAAFDQQIAPVAAQVPVITGEFGSDTCNPTFLKLVMDWCDAHGVSYLAWTWNATTNPCSTMLISDWSGTPNQYGVPVHDHLATFP